MTTINHQNSLLGACLGDIAGSTLEYSGNRDTNVKLWREDGFITDDSILSVAIMDGLMNENQFEKYLRIYGGRYPHAGYGKRFKLWLVDEHPGDSQGNGSVMRVSPVAYAAKTHAECLVLAGAATKPSHNSHEAISCAMLVSSMVWLGLNGGSKEAVLGARKASGLNLPEPAPIEYIRKHHQYSEMVIGTVQTAIACVRDSDDFEGAIRNAVSVGGDADTIAAVTGSIAGPLYGIPDDLVKFAFGKMPPELVLTLAAFTTKYIKQTEAA